MAAIGLGIIGKNNSPLYIRDFLSDGDGDDYDRDEAVLFGMEPLPASASASASASSECWFILHAALDRLEQLTLTPVGRKKTIPNSAANPDNNNTNNSFLGMLLPIEETRVYGYLTNTNIKFILILKM